MGCGCWHTDYMLGPLPPHFAIGIWKERFPIAIWLFCIPLKAGFLNADVLAVSCPFAVNILRSETDTSQTECLHS